MTSAFESYLKYIAQLSKSDDGDERDGIREMMTDCWLEMTTEEQRVANDVAKILIEE